MPKKKKNCETLRMIKWLNCNWLIYIVIIYYLSCLFCWTVFLLLNYFWSNCLTWKAFEMIAQNYLKICYTQLHVVSEERSNIHLWHLLRNPPPFTVFSFFWFFEQNNMYIVIMRWMKMNLGHFFSPYTLFYGYLCILMYFGSCFVSWKKLSMRCYNFSFISILTSFSAFCTFIINILLAVLL